MINSNSTLTAKNHAEFLRDFTIGMSALQKYIPPKYFYDSTGDALFQQIMALTEYYITRCEHEVLTAGKEKLLDHIRSKNTPFEIVELGAGDGYKTRILLRHFLSSGANFTYMPNDISENALAAMTRKLSVEFPKLNIEPLQCDYFHALQNFNSDTPRLILFLGASIGNFTMEEAANFLTQLAGKLNPTDRLLIGFDLKKDPFVIRDAYNDSAGVTKNFNLNLLKRINSELGGCFSIDDFSHYPSYDPITGEAKSYLVSRREHDVYVESLGTSIHFDEGETIYTEISLKYDQRQVHELASRCGFEVVEDFTDSKNYFVDSLWKLKQ